MRLTLRTMLAYMDGLLEPEDAEEIGKKIEESEFATSLLHRIRDVTRRLRLGTPDVLERGLGLDPNTVAEYLDNTLAPDRVLDFEKVCLESDVHADVHLAEVASCHQILALVLGEPAEVDPASRQRMYQLAKLAEAQPQAAVASQQGPGAGQVPPGPPAVSEPGQPPIQAAQAQPGALEALRAEARQRAGVWRQVAMLVVSLAGVVLVLAVTGQFAPGSFLGDLLGRGKPAERLVAQSPEPPLPTDDGSVVPVQPPSAPPDEGRAATPEPGGPAPAGPQAGSSAAQVPAASSAIGPKAETPPSVSPEGGQTRAHQPGEPAPPPAGAVATPGPAGRSEPTPAAPRAVGERPAEPEPGAMPGSGQVGDSGPGMTVPRSEPERTAPAPSAEAPLGELRQPSTARAADVAEPAGQAEATASGEARTPPGAPAAPAPLPVEVLGQFDSPMQILLARDAETGVWQRVRDQAPLVGRTEYLCLPTYRAMIRLRDNVELWLIDGTQIELAPPDEQGIPSLVVAFGRLVVGPAEATGTRLRLRAGDRSGVITFADAGSQVAVEVNSVPIAGSDPESQPGRVTTDLYVTSGKVLWQDDAGREPVAVNAPVRLTLRDQPLEAQAVERLPNWIVADTMSLLDQRASATVERELNSSRPAVLGLRELANHRRREVRWLALRCLDYLGDFELMVAALDDAEHKNEWPDCVEQLRAAVARSSEAAAQVRGAMEKLHGEEGATLYQMLWRYHDPLTSGEAAQLVEALDHNTLAFRVVAFHTLRRVTKLSLGYQPDDPAAKRRPWIEKWKDRLKPVPAAAPEGQGAQPSPPEATRFLPDDLLFQGYSR